MLDYSLEISHKGIVPLQIKSFIGILHSILKKNRKFSIEITKRNNEIKLVLSTDKKELTDIFETYYSGVFLRPIKRDSTYSSKKTICFDIHPIFPIKFYEDGNSSLFLGFASILKRIKSNQSLRVSVKPASKKSCKKLFDAAKIYSRFPNRFALALSEFFIIRKLLPKSEITNQRIREKVHSRLFSVSFELLSDSKNDFTENALSVFSTLSDQNKFKVINKKSSVILCLEELANFFVLPAAKEFDQLKSNSYKKLESSSLSKDGAEIGYAVDKSIVKAEIKNTAIIGRSGSGKTTCAKNMIKHILDSGDGCCIVDPTGELVKDTLAMIPESRKSDVILIDPTDKYYAIAFNPLAIKDDSLSTGFVTDMFGHIFSKSWGRRSDYFLRNAINTLISNNGSLMDVSRLFNDAEYRTMCLKNITDPVVRQFWEEEYQKMPKRLRIETISPILNKVNRLMMIPSMRNILGQSENRIDFSELIENKKIILISLDKGKLGGENISLLGAIFIFSLLSGAMKKIRNDRFTLIIDELQNFLPAEYALSTILNEGRKYSLQLVSIFQSLSAQIDNQRFIGSLLANSDNLIPYKLNHADAQILANHIGKLSHYDMVNLPFFKGYLHNISGTCLFESKRVNQPIQNFTEEIRELSRKKYAQKKEDVEREINNFINVSNMP